MSKITAYLLLLLPFLLPSSARAATTYTNGLTITKPGTYENLDVTNPNGYCIKITSPNVILKNSKVHDCNGFGVWIESVSDVQLIGNEITNTVLNTCYPSCGGGWESAIKVRSANQTDKLAQNILIEGNLVYNNLGEGAAVRGSKITIRNNTFYDNFSVNIYSNGDHVTVDRNFVYCTGASRYLRDGSVPAGIAQGDETYAGWNPSHANNMLVTNNIVTGCKYGFRYLGAEPGVDQAGLKDSTVAFNTFACTTNAGISIPFEPSQANLTIHNNISSATSIANTTGVSNMGNVNKTFTCGVYKPEIFRLNSPQSAQGTFAITSDYLGISRTAPIDAGAYEYVPTTNSTSVPTPTPEPPASFATWLANYLKNLTGHSYGDFDNNGRVDGVDYVLGVLNYGF